MRRDVVIQPRERGSPSRPQPQDTQTDIRRACTPREDPCVPAGRDAIAKMQDDRVGVDVAGVDDVLGAALHVARADPRVDSRPSSDGPLDTIGPDATPRANPDLLV